MWYINILTYMYDYMLNQCHADIFKHWQAVMPTDQAMTWFLCMNKFGGRCGQCFSIKLYMYYMVTLFRYYVAEGVRIYCQQSWKMVVGTEGKQLVEKYITEIVSTCTHLLCGLLLWKGILPNYYCSNKIGSVGAFRNHTSLLANLFCGAKNHFSLLYFRCVDVCKFTLVWKKWYKESHSKKMKWYKEKHSKKMSAFLFQW